MVASPVHAVSGGGAALAARGRDLAAAAATEAGAPLAEAERRPPTAMAGSDEVNRNECRVRARQPPPSLSPFLGTSLPCTIGSVWACSRPSLRPAPASVSREGCSCVGSRFVPPLYDSVERGDWGQPWPVISRSIAPFLSPLGSIPILSPSPLPPLFLEFRWGVVRGDATEMATQQRGRCQSCQSLHLFWQAAAKDRRPHWPSRPCEETAKE